MSALRAEGVEHPADGEPDPEIALGALGPVAPGIPQPAGFLVAGEPGHAAGDVGVVGAEADLGEESSADSRSVHQKG